MLVKDLTLRIIQPMPSCNVGSPDPTKVSHSISPGSCTATAFSISATISVGGKKEARWLTTGLVRPSWQ
jgi:hypothetical protein